MQYAIMDNFAGKRAMEMLATTTRRPPTQKEWRKGPRKKKDERKKETGDNPKKPEGNEQGTKTNDRTMTEKQNVNKGRPQVRVDGRHRPGRQYIRQV